MSPFAATTLLTAFGVIGLAVAASGWAQPAPSLERTLAHLRRPGPVPNGTSGTIERRHDTGPVITAPVVGFLAARPRLVPTAAELNLAGRTLDQHVGHLCAAALTGLVLPPLMIGLLQAAGVIGLGVFVPLGLAIGGAVLGPVVVHSVVIEQAATARADLRHQLSAYLDVVTMLLAGNTGYEGALEQAARAGDGRLFAELRRRMRESGARGASLTDALAHVGHDLGLDELEQIAATAALSAAEGAPVARTLAAKCSTLRTTLSTEQEAEARLRTSRLTTPIVGMALIFMALVMYPALNFS